VTHSADLPNSTRGAVYQDLVARLRAGGMASADLDARLLIAAAAGVDGIALIADPDRLVPGEARAALERFAQRRLSGEPVSRILGTREFWGLSFLLNEQTLDPRPDSETLVEAVLRHVPDKNASLKLLDLGTGTGCLLLALLSELPNAHGRGVDYAPEAIEAAAANADQLGLAAQATFTVGDWGDGLSGPFDLVISNPPYIPSADIETLSPEVRLHDPMKALDGGDDGLAAYRAIALATARLLAPTGCAFWELGIGQVEDVSLIAQSAGLDVLGADPDLAGIPRILRVRRRK
jgi:release factor glutamine methyltransferase